MASLTPTGLETITYGQQGWNAIVTANMQRLNTWLGKLLPLMDSQSRTAGAVPVWKSRLPPRIKAVPERSGAAFAI